MTLTSDPAVAEFVRFASCEIGHRRHQLDALVTAHLFYADLHAALAVGGPAVERYCPTFEKAWVDVVQCQDLVPGFHILNRAILLAVAENRRTIYQKAFDLGLVPPNWLGWYPTMRPPERDLLGWLNERLKPEVECSGLMYYATAARLGEVYPGLITIPYLEATMLEKFPMVTYSLLDTVCNSPKVICDRTEFMVLAKDVLKKRMGVACGIGLNRLAEVGIYFVP